MNGDELTLAAGDEPGTYRATVVMDRYQYAGDTGPMKSVTVLALAKDAARNAAVFTDSVELAADPSVPTPPTPTPTPIPSRLRPLRSRPRRS